MQKKNLLKGKECGIHIGLLFDNKRLTVEGSHSKNSSSLPLNLQHNNMATNGMSCTDFELYSSAKEFCNTDFDYFIWIIS
ncbi:unnamed protein product [Amoebophrya sp. A25]|nr:unnamed protein product [Amoebophrya sp. A25]|eukprot:GSA25T00006016001.1